MSSTNDRIVATGLRLLFVFSAAQAFVWCLDKAPYLAVVILVLVLGSLFSQKTGPIGVVTLTVIVTCFLLLSGWYMIWEKIQSLPPELSTPKIWYAENKFGIFFYVGVIAVWAVMLAVEDGEFHK